MAAKETAADVAAGWLGSGNDSGNDGSNGDGIGNGDGCNNSDGNGDNNGNGFSNDNGIGNGDRTSNIDDEGVGEAATMKMVISLHFVKCNKARATNPSPHYHQKLDPSMPKSLIRGNKGGKGEKRQGPLLVKTWEVVKTVPSTRMRAAQRRRMTTKKSNKAEVEIAYSSRYPTFSRYSVIK